MFRHPKTQVLVVLAIGGLLGYLAAISNVSFDRTARASLHEPAAVTATADHRQPLGRLQCAPDDPKELLLAQADIRLVQAQPNRTQTTSSGNGKKPNILFIMGDDIGWFNIGAYHRGIMS